VRVLRALAAAALAVAAGAFLPSGDDGVAARPTGSVIGVYQARLRGDGWSARNPSSAAEVQSKKERISGTARIEVVARDPDVNDGFVTVRVYLDAKAAKSLLGSATPKNPAFEGTAALAGDAFAAIDTGQPNYVNALSLRFDRRGRKVQGDWMAVYPALEADLAAQKFAASVTVSLSGRRVPGAIPTDEAGSAASRALPPR